MEGFIYEGLSYSRRHKGVLFEGYVFRGPPKGIPFEVLDVIIQSFIICIFLGYRVRGVCVFFFFFFSIYK